MKQMSQIHLFQGDEARQKTCEDRRNDKDGNLSRWLFFGGTPQKSSTHTHQTRRLFWLCSVTVLGIGVRVVGARFGRPFSEVWLRSDSDGLN